MSDGLHELTAQLDTLITERLAHLETRRPEERLDEGALAAVRTEVKLDNLIKTTKDHEARLRALEKPFYVSQGKLWLPLIAAATIVASLAAAAAKLLAGLFTGP